MLEDVQKTKNLEATGRNIGISWTSDDQGKTLADCDGLEALRPKARRRPQIPQATYLPPGPSTRAQLGHRGRDAQAHCPLLGRVSYGVWRTHESEAGYVTRGNTGGMGGAMHRHDARACRVRRNGRPALSCWTRL